VSLEAARAVTDPKVFTAIKMHFVVVGKGLKANLVERAIKLSHDKYCSATAMLGKSASIAIDWEIKEVD
jgi:putative redox protein